MRNEQCVSERHDCTSAFTSAVVYTRKAACCCKTPPATAAKLHHQDWLYSADVSCTTPLSGWSKLGLASLVPSVISALRWSLSDLRHLEDT